MHNALHLCSSPAQLNVVCHLAHIMHVMQAAKCLPVRIWSSSAAGLELKRSRFKVFCRNVSTIRMPFGRQNIGFWSHGNKLPVLATSFHSVVDDFVISFGNLRFPLSHPFNGHSPYRLAYASRNPSGSSLKSQPCVNGFCRNRRITPIRVYWALGWPFWS